MTTDLITYEQPLNEQIRLNLRIEQLFRQLKHHLQGSGQQSSQLALETIVNIIQLTDKPDLGTKLAQMLSQQMRKLAALEESPEVDQEKLQSLLHRLDCILDVLNHGGRKKIAENLREHSLLKHIRQHSAQSGSAQLASPAYLLWLHQPEAQRQRDIRQWLSELQILDDAVSNILQLLRDTANAQTVNANNTFYQQSLDAHLNCHMVRITLPVSYGIYPRTSIGKHRLSIRFEALPTQETPDQQEQKLQTEFPFELHCCYT